MQKLLVLFVLSFIQISSVFSQLEFPKEFNNSIVLTNGKILNYEVINVSQFEMKYKDDRDKIETISVDKIFSYQKSNEDLTMVYKKDPEKGNDLTPGEMKKFVMGSYDARNNYNGMPLLIAGAALSYSAVFIDTYLFSSEANAMNESPDFPGNNFTPGPFKSEPSVFPIFVPLTFSLATAVPKTRLKKKHVSFVKYKEDTIYQRGFEKMARQKRVMNSLTGSVGGLLLGYLSYFIVGSLR